ncbi:MAG: acyl-CoA dehydrogenase family protein [Desulfosudaceae bacterium]
MISGAEKKALLNQEPRFDDIMCGLRATGRQPKGIIKEMKTIMALARKFNEEVARPYALELDWKMHDEPDYLPWDFVKKANEWGFYTLFIPKVFGGQGFSFSCIGCLLEELGSVCASLANLVGVHYLGYTGLMTTFNVRLMDQISRDVVEGEKTGEPRLISFAMTEPDAGTDSQVMEFMDAGSLACLARKVEGGYEVNGTKIFISCGHLATWHILYAYTDLEKASENMTVLVVKTGMDGFSFGKKENKMGQKASVASELVFRNCFIPDEYVALDRTQIDRLSRSPRETAQQVLSYIWAASRTGVAALGTGSARGALETALTFAETTEMDGRLLINHEWCQLMLAEMYNNVAVGRLTYTETATAVGMHALTKLFNFKPVYYLLKYTPLPLLNPVASRTTRLRLMTWAVRKLYFDLQSDDEIARTDGWGSVAKVVGTDAGMKNARMALDIMGKAGVRHDQGAEKIMRDCKLYQIYEGTNQINRLEVFKWFLQRRCPGTVCLSLQCDDGD